MKKPITLYLLQRADFLYRLPPEKQLSPLFAHAEDRRDGEIATFDAIVSGIEHSLGMIISSAKLVDCEIIIVTKVA